MKKIEKAILRKQIYDAKVRQGDEAEQYVESLLEENRSADKLPPWLLGWVRHGKWSYFDINGVDITIYVDVGEIHLNVKSSEAFMWRFKRLHGDKGIVVFILNQREDRPRAFGRLISILSKKRLSMPQC